MCLRINHDIHGATSPQPLRTKRPLLVEKGLERCVDTYYSPYRGAAYKLGKLYEVDDFSYGSRTYRARVKKGLHAIRWKRDHISRFMAAEILPAIIPAGSLIYIGTNNDVVSNKLIVFGSLGEAAKYLGIKKFDAPIDTRRLPHKEIIHEIGQKVRV